MPENSSCSSASTCSRESCEGCPSKAKGGSGIAKEPMNKASNVKKVIGVVSGKGGVGKSFVTSSLACAMNKAGYKVGIMDADITGPSIPKMFGVHGQVYGTEDGMVPMAAENGIKITGDYAVLVSDGLLVDGPGWVAKQLELSAAAGDPPEKVARILVETARARAEQTGRPDDITAAVLRLEPCGH